LAEAQHDKNVLQSEIDLFSGNLSNILSSPTETISPTLDSIRDKIKSLHFITDNGSKTIRVLEQKLEEVTHQLERQCELHTETLRRAKRLEAEKNSSQDKFNSIEDNLAATSVLNSTLQSQRIRFTTFLQDLADALKLTDTETARDLEVRY
jgi:predicted nuclease with TOPRIM domain